MKLQAMRLQRSQGLQARPRRSAVVSVRAIAEQVEVPSALKSGGSSWKPNSWREKPALQQPDYQDKAEVAKACEVGHRTLRRVTSAPRAYLMLSWISHDLWYVCSLLLHFPAGS